MIVMVYRSHFNESAAGVYICALSIYKTLIDKICSAICELLVSLFLKVLFIEQNSCKFAPFL